MKLKMLKGLPASGKSTHAKELLSKNGNLGRVNRDEIRQMVFNGKWSHHNEKITIEIEKAIATVLLDHGRDVIVDDTNLTEKHESLWRSFVNIYNMPEPVSPEKKPVVFEQEKIDTSIEECIRRDKMRQSKGLPYVGRNVIIKMAAKNGLIQWPENEIVLVDVDGTLSDGRHREHIVRGPVKDWDRYFSLLGNDKPYTHIFQRVAELAKTHTIVIVSGRGAENEYETMNWFEKVWAPNPLFPELEVPKFPVFQWFFRNKGDRRPDTEVKKEVLALLPKKPVLVLDDRPSVCRMWEENGLTVDWVRGRDLEEF